jgi:hypothetical protein
VGTMAANYHRSVFVNCPFDESYAPLLRAMVFAVVDCGFNPRCALESSDASEVRIQKIYRVIGACGLGIHDLSRTELDPGTRLPRFNMPLELGIFLGAKFLGEGDQQKKACLVFDEKPYRYQMYLSDVAGQDIAWHDNSPKNLICRLRDWLASVAPGHLPSGSIVWDHYETFQGELRERCAQHKQRPEELTYNDVLRHIIAFRESYQEELDIQGNQTIRNPSADQIRTAIKSVKSTDPNPFVILIKGASGLTYTQALMEREAIWTIEYQDGHLDQHFRATNEQSTENVIQFFVSYLNGEASWRESANWEPIEI